MKYLSIGINLCMIVICMVLLYICDIHILSANDLDNKKYATSIGSINQYDGNYENNKYSNVSLNNQNMVLANGSVVPQQEESQTPSVSTTSPLVSGDVLETQVGTMSAYGPNCQGCSGHLGGGFDASGGNYIYSDGTFGNVRIVAGDPKYPYGTIVKVSNSKLGDFNAIVLDRGGAIGIGRRFLFDLLFATEADAAAFGTSYDVVFEVLRYGY